jgi:hypothetical protein
MSLFPSATHANTLDSYYATSGGAPSGGAVTAEQFVSNGVEPASAGVSGFIVDSTASRNFVARATGGTLYEEAFSIASASDAGRWTIGVGNAESGANVGSDLEFNYYTDAGVLGGTALTVERGNGNLVSTNGTDGLTVGNSGSITVSGGGIVASGNIGSQTGNITASIGSVSGTSLVSTSASMTTASMTVGTYSVLSSTPTTIAMTVNASKPVREVLFTDAANFFFDQSYPNSFNTVIIWDDADVSAQIGFIASNAAVCRSFPLGTMLTLKWNTFPTAASTLEVQCIGQSTPAISLFIMSSATPQSVYTAIKVRDNGDSDDWVRMSYV